MTKVVALTLAIEIIVATTLSINDPINSFTASSSASRLGVGCNLDHLLGRTK
jgi:hypothetical protein